MVGTVNPLDLEHYEGNIVDALKALTERVRLLEGTELSGVAGPPGPTGEKGDTGDDGSPGPGAPAPLTQGDVLVVDAVPAITTLGIGAAHSMMKVNAAGTDPDWEAFDWDEMSGVAGADMAHDHSAAGEGGATLNPTLVDLNGNADALVLDVDGDTSISAPTDDQIDIEVGGVDIGTLTASGLALVASRDVYPEGDEGGLFERNVDHWRSPNDHFNTFSGWTWSAVAPFDGAPNLVDVSNYGSILYLRNNDITEDHFAYKSGAIIALLMRLTRGANSYIGGRLDDGTDSNYVQVTLVDGTSTGMFRVKFESRVGGGAITTTYALDGLPPSWYVLQLLATSGSPWSVYVYTTKDTFVPLYLGLNASGLTWTVSRYGIIFGQRGVASSHDRSCHVDWIEYS